MSKRPTLSLLLGHIQDPPIAAIGSSGGAAIGCVLTALAGAQGFSGLILLVMAAGIGSLVGYRIVKSLNAKFGDHAPPKHLKKQ